MVDAELAATAAHLFVRDLSEPELAEADRHHVERVLRLRPGATLSVSDGAGSWRLAELGPAGGLVPVGPVRVVAEPSGPITIGFALVKGDRADAIVQKLTECGVDRIIPFVASRSIVRWSPDKAERQVDRWRAIAREAASQSRRVHLPAIDGVCGFDDALAAAGGVVADLEGEAPAPDDRRVLVGPEGGWSPEERRSAGRRLVLGPQVLRADTAAVVAGALLTALRARLVQASGPPDAS